MSTLPRRFAVPFALIVALALAPALSGCTPNALVKTVVGQHVEVGSTTIPADFPKAIPLVKGKVLHAAGIGGNGSKMWLARIQTTGPSAANEVAKGLKAEGFDIIYNLPTTTGTGRMLSAHTKTVAVMLIISKASTGYVATYTVSEHHK